MKPKNLLLAGGLVVVAGAVGAILFVPTVPFAAQDETECCAMGDAQAAAPTPTPTPAPAPGADAAPANDAGAVQARADRYAKLLERAENAAALAAQRETLPTAARPVVDAAPLPPPTATPGGLPTPEALKKWSGEYDDAMAEQVAEDGGQGLFQLLGTMCNAAVSAVGAPEAGGLCDLVGPILQALGLSLGEGDDIQEAAQALLAVQNGDYGPLKAYLAQQPEVQDGLVRLMKNLEGIDAQARERLLGHDLRQLPCSQILAVLAAEANETQRALLVASIDDPRLRVQVQQQCQ